MAVRTYTLVISQGNSSYNESKNRRMNVDIYYDGICVAFTVPARGFGMRVVGGKTGADGRLFAYIVWTVPGGPAEKGGLQQGDKVLEWCGVALTDRSFEEVCAIMDRTGDMAELLVEHATDFRMCDLLEEPMPMISRKPSDASAVGLQIGKCSCMTLHTVSVHLD